MTEDEIVRWASLSAREQQIAQLAAIGRTNAEIADELRMSLRTVEWNLTRVFRKIGVRSRTELAAHLAGTSWAERPIVESGNDDETVGTEDQGVGG